MPFLGADPWQRAFFESVASDGVAIPVTDAAAWDAFPQHRWVYNKLVLAETQGLACAPHGVTPPSWPVFSKPIVNLAGMGVGSRVVAEPEWLCTPGHFWMPHLEGEHVSTDVAIVRGEAVWSRHAIGVPAGGGTFERWEVRAERFPRLETALTAWCANHLAGHTGVVNFETIGGTIIETHLRFSGQFADLYGEGWLEAVVGLHRRGVWSFEDADRRPAWSLPLFVAEDGRYDVDADALGRLREQVRSIQLTFEPPYRLSEYAHPPGGLLIAFVNGFDLDAAVRTRAELKAAFRRAP